MTACKAASALASGELRAGSSSFTAGRLGQLEVRGDNVLLGVPFRFDASNIDRFEF